MEARRPLGDVFGDVDATGGADAAAEFLEELGHVPAFVALKRRSLDLLQAGEADRALDLGCGLGDDVAALARRVGPRGTAIGVDRSRHLIEMARARHDGADFVVAEAGSLPFEPASFDRCRVERVLQHVEAPQRVLREVRRVLRPGGTLVITEAVLVVDGSAPHPPDPVLEALLERVSLRGRAGSWLARFYPALMARAGFQALAVDEHRERIHAAADVRRCLGIRPGVGPEEPDLAAWWAAFSAALAGGTRWLELHGVHLRGHASAP